MNEIFDKLIKNKIKTFVNDYKKLSREIFVNEEGKLIHSGEFGTYREIMVKKLIEPFLPARLAVGSGFIITNKNKISTQCDLIIYDKSNTPIIETDEQRFFPIECIVGVIEVKSQLSKTQLKEALIKLSKIKNLRNDVESKNFTYRIKDFGIPCNAKLIVHDQIATLLICEKIKDFNYTKDTNTFFKKTYKDIDKSLFHNMILSVDDGCFMYSYRNKSQDFHFYYPYGNYNENNYENELVTTHPDGYEYEHILGFVNNLYMLISSVSVLNIDITKYLGAERLDKTFKETKN